MSTWPSKVPIEALNTHHERVIIDSGALSAAPVARMTIFIGAGEGFGRLDVW